MSNQIKIETTQNVVIHYQPASLGDRILAGLIDMAIKVAYVILAIIIFASLNRTGLLQGDAFIGIMILMLLIPYLFYDLALEVFLNGQTVGKRQMKIKVIRLDGTEPNIGAYLLRWVLAPIDGLFYHSVAMICIVTSNKGQRLGDMAAGTSVIKLTTDKKHSLDDLLVVKEEVPGSYFPTYMQATILTDQDINLIKEVIVRYKKTTDSKTLEALAIKIKEVLNIPYTEQYNLQFLETIVSDYNYLVSQKN